MLNKYLESLNHELSGLDIEERNNIMDFVEEMINDRIEIGQNEQEILDSLGEPKEFAKNFIGNEEFKKIENKIEPAINRHLKFADVRKLDIESISYSYLIQSTTDDQLTIDYEDIDDSSLNITMKNGTLKIEQDPMNQFDFSNMFRKWSERKNIFTAGTVTINIPENYNCDLDLENVSGKIEIDGVSLAKTYIENVSGKITINNIFVDKLDCETVSGSIDITQLSSASTIDIESVSGYIKLQDTNCDHITIESVSGSVNTSILGKYEDYNIEIEGLFNNKTINNNGHKSLNIETVSGSINYNFI